MKHETWLLIFLYRKSPCSHLTDQHDVGRIGAMVILTQSTIGFECS